MKLMTKEILNKIPALYAQEKLGDDAIVYVKFFDPGSMWTWYATEYSPEERTFFGLVIGQETELGYFSLDELQSVRNKFGLGIERDTSFKPKTLKAVKEELARVYYRKEVIKKDEIISPQSPYNSLR
jgi:hypothetical protein